MCMIDDLRFLLVLEFSGPQLPVLSFGPSPRGSAFPPRRRGNPSHFTPTQSLRYHFIFTACNLPHFTATPRRLQCVQRSPVSFESIRNRLPRHPIACCRPPRRPNELQQRHDPSQGRNNRHKTVRRRTSHREVSCHRRAAKNRRRFWRNSGEEGRAASMQWAMT